MEAFQAGVENDIVPLHFMRADTIAAAGADVSQRLARAVRNQRVVARKQICSCCASCRISSLITAHLRVADQGEDQAAACHIASERRQEEMGHELQEANLFVEDEKQDLNRSHDD